MPPVKKKEEDFEIPVEYGELHFPDGIPLEFQKAFNHAKLVGNRDKAALIYAEHHAQDFKDKE